MHHPRTRNVTISTVGLKNNNNNKNGHIRKNLTKNYELQRHCWERRRRRNHFNSPIVREPFKVSLYWDWRPRWLSGIAFTARAGDGESLPGRFMSNIGTLMTACSARRVMLMGQHWDWLFWCQNAATGWDCMSGLQLLSQNGSTYSSQNRSVSEMHGACCKHVYQPTIQQKSPQTTLWTRYTGTQQLPQITVSTDRGKQTL